MEPLCKRIAELSILLALEEMCGPHQQQIVPLHKVAPCGATGILWPADRKDLKSIALVPWPARQRADPVRLTRSTHTKDPGLTRALEDRFEKRGVTRRRMRDPTVAPLTVLTHELEIGTLERLRCETHITAIWG